jgi:hypothetical protein
LGLEAAAGVRWALIRSAIISDCGQYRHVLTRVWNPQLPMVAFCGLNPSTADGTKDDPTMRREVGYAKRWGYGGLIKVNAYDFRTTHPKVLLKTPFPYSGNNWLFMADAALAADRFLCCWGTHVDDAIRGRQAHLVSSLLELGIELWALQVTQHDNPRHPLYLRGDLEPFVWKWK